MPQNECGLVFDTDVVAHLKHADTLGAVGEPRNGVQNGNEAELMAGEDRPRCHRELSPASRPAARSDRPLPGWLKFAKNVTQLAFETGEEICRSHEAAQSRK